MQRLDKIIAGEMRIGSGGGGPRLSSVERIARTMAENHAIDIKKLSSKEAKAWARENADAFIESAKENQIAIAAIKIDLDV